MTVAYEGWFWHALRVRDARGNIIHSPITCPTCIEREERRKYMITQADLKNWFTYHPPTPEQIPKYEAIRAAGLAFAQVLLDNTPASAEQSAAIRLAREACWTANASIACKTPGDMYHAPELPSASVTTVDLVAQALHEVNRVYCQSLGDHSQKHWEDAPDWAKESAKDGVTGILKGNSPEKSHEGWLAKKTADGWKFGPVKNEATKEHPCFMPYHELPPAQQRKDHLFVKVGRALLEVLK